MAAFAWLMGTKVGRMLAGAGAIALAIGLAALRIFAAGKAAERARQDKASLENRRKRERTDDDVAAMDAARRRDELAKWVRD